MPFFHKRKGALKTDQSVNMSCMLLIIGSLQTSVHEVHLVMSWTCMDPRVYGLVKEPWLVEGSRLKGMPREDVINIRNNDVRHLIPKVCSAVLKNGAEILTESIVKWIILSKLFCCKDLKSFREGFEGLFIATLLCCESPLSKCKYK